jgi:hypothetical protein
LINNPDASSRRGTADAPREEPSNPVSNATIQRALLGDGYPIRQSRRRGYCNRSPIPACRSGRAIHQLRLIEPVLRREFSRFTAKQLSHRANEREQLMLRIVHFGGVSRNAKLFMRVHKIRLYFFSTICRANFSIFPSDARL